MINDLEIARRQHVERYGSMLFCPERETVCSFMDRAWITGCTRKGGCILDDPEDQELQRKIEENRRQATEKSIMQEREEIEAEQIRNQTKAVRNKIDRKMDEAHRLEALSQKAYHNNRPNKGEEYFMRARRLRFEAWELAKKNGMRI